MPTRTPSTGDIAEELFDLLNGFGILVLPLFPRALPAVVLAVGLALPLAAAALVASILVAPPVMVVRALRRRGATP